MEKMETSMRHYMDKMLHLNEYVDRKEVTDAIENKNIVTIFYGGDNTINKGFRTIEPYVLGKTKLGNLAVRAWQQAGSSDTPDDPRAGIPGWRLFKLDGITTFQKTDKIFDITSGHMNSKRPHYNPQDKAMSQIITAIDTIGTDEIPQQTSPSQDQSFFSSQADKFKNFFQQPSKPQDKSFLGRMKNLFTQAASRNFT